MNASQLLDDVEVAKKMDSEDPLKSFKKRFYLRQDTIYLCGNSLGLASKDSIAAVLKMLSSWKEDGVQIWSSDNYKCFRYSDYLAKLMAVLVGCNANEIVFIGSTTVSIHQAISTLYKPNKEKYKILIDDVNFASDRYAVESQVKLKGFEPTDVVKVIMSTKENLLSETDIIDAMTEDVAVVLLPGVVYTTAQLLDIDNITKTAQQRGIVIGWDLTHAVGAVDLDLHNSDIDFAVWSTYKYLNGGPGSIAATYVNRKHFYKVPGLAGWFGNKKETQLLMQPKFAHQEDASGWQIGTPSLLSMATMEGSLKMFLEAGMSNIRKKSLKLTSYLMYLVEKKLKRYGFEIATPRDDARRGGHVSLVHDKAYSISLALRDHGVISDYRHPNQIRFTPTALYTSYMEVLQMTEIVVKIMNLKLFEQHDNCKSCVV